MYPCASVAGGVPARDAKLLILMTRSVESAPTVPASSKRAHSTAMSTRRVRLRTIVRRRLHLCSWYFVVPCLYRLASEPIEPSIANAIAFHRSARVRFGCSLSRRTVNDILHSVAQALM